MRLSRLRAALPRLQGVDLLPYHRLGRGKLARLGLPMRFPESVAPPSIETVEGWKKYLGL